MRGFSLMYLGQLEGVGLVAPTCLTVLLSAKEETSVLLLPNQNSPGGW